MNALLIFKHLLKNEEIKIEKEETLYALSYGKLKHLSTDGIDNGIIALLKLVTHNIFDANLWTYNKFIENSITLGYAGEIPSLDTLKSNCTKLMLSPTGIDYESQKAILAEYYVYKSYDDIDFSEFAYIHRLMDRLKEQRDIIVVEGLKK